MHEFQGAPALENAAAIMGSKVLLVAFRPNIERKRTASGAGAAFLKAAVLAALAVDIWRDEDRDAEEDETGVATGAGVLARTPKYL